MSGQFNSHHKYLSPKPRPTPAPGLRPGYFHLWFLEPKLRITQVACLDLLNSIDSSRQADIVHLAISPDSLDLFTVTKQTRNLFRQRGSDRRIKPGLLFHIEFWGFENDHVLAESTTDGSAPAILVERRAAGRAGQGFGIRHGNSAGEIGCW
jgi:hypothetical protein